MLKVDPAPIAHLLQRVNDADATDLHLTVGAPPLMRHNGHLEPLEEKPLTANELEQMLREFLADLLPEFETRKEIDFSFDFGDARYRGNAFRQRGTLCCALRHIPNEIPSFEALGLPPIIEEFARLPQGLVLVTGPTGSGKSTTLASMIDWINTHRRCHVLTIEDPVEYVHSHKASIVNQREIGPDADDFHTGLRAALREDPDVLLVGEMRDPESISVALSIAETGHLVFATLHTNDTAQALDRIIDVFPAERRDQIQVQLASTLQGIVYQRLLPRMQGGLVAAFEIMRANHAIRNLIREGKTRQLRNVVSTHQSVGMQTLEMALTDLVADGVIDYETAVGFSIYPKEIKTHRMSTIAAGGSITADGTDAIDVVDAGAAVADVAVPAESAGEAGADARPGGRRGLRRR